MKNPTDVGQSALALALLGDDRRSRWVRRIAVGMSAYQLGKNAYEWVESKRDKEKFKLSVNDSDQLFDTLQRWFIDQLPPNQRRAIVARTEYKRKSDDTPDAAITLHVDDDTWQDVKIEGHTIRVVVEQVDIRKLSGDDLVSSGGGLKKSRMVFAAATYEGREAVVRLLEEQLTSLRRHDRSSDVYMLSSWGDWNRISGLQPRSLDSVILTGTVLDDLVEDLQNFYDNELRYVNLGLPWHLSLIHI